MKINYVLLPAVLTIALTLPTFGQATGEPKPRTGMKHHDMSKTMDKPTVDATVEGLHLKVWLMTQKEHKAMMKEMKEMKDTSMGMGKDMKGMKHDGMAMDKATKAAMMAGTHHMMLDLRDTGNEEGITNATAKVQVLSPSKKNSSVNLIPMKGHFGGAFTLKEKGAYRFTVNVEVGGVTKTTQFPYTVK